MRILMLNHNVAWSGGTFFRAHHFARQMVRRGHAVTLLTISPRSRFSFRRELHDGVQIVETPDLLWGRGRTGWDLWDTLRRSLYVRGQSWDIIHAFDSRPAVVLPALAARQDCGALIMDWADWWGQGGTIGERQTGALVKLLIGPLETFFEEHFRTYARATTVISTALRQRAIALGVHPKSITQIPQGSDIERVRPLPRNQSREILGLPEKAPIVGYLGVLLRQDAQLLFDTFATLRTLRPDSRLLLIGNHKAVVPDIPGIQETGFVPHAQMLQALSACDIMLLPLKDNIASRGRWPSKINDYLAAGRPIVASAVGDVSDLFARHAIGTATVDTPVALAQAVDALLSDTARCQAAGHIARQVAESEFDWPILAERLETHYHTALST